MSCPYPIKIKNPNYKKYENHYTSWNRELYYYVPCGKCLSCRIAKTQWLQDACNWEYNHYGIGSFTTLTYDDVEYQKLWNEDNKRFEPNYKDIQDFLKRLRTRLKRKTGINIEFKYVVVCETGEENGRIHYHILFFGLDYKNNDLDIYRAWDKGIVQNLPIKKGAIRYVLKYMTKDIVAFREKYNIGKNNRLFKYSTGLGKGLIEEKQKEIIKNNGCYDNGSGKLKSLPPYWQNKLQVKCTTNYNPIRKKMKEEHWDDTRHWTQYTKTECLNYMKEKAQLKEKIAIEKARQKGSPQDNFKQDLSDTLWNEKI